MAKLYNHVAWACEERIEPRTVRAASLGLRTLASDEPVASSVHAPKAL